MLRRCFDILVSASGILLLLPVFIVIGIAVRLTSPGAAIFRQERVGRQFRSFKIYKFRTMVNDAPSLGGPITFGRDPRITWIGALLRKTKIDELPQLLNVLRGDMSLVGPRPENPEYVELYRNDYKEVLTVRPGITDLASIRFRDEAEILGHAQDPEREYVERVLPEKIRLAKEYIQRSSFVFDVLIIAKTLLKVVWPSPVEPPCPRKTASRDSATPQTIDHNTL
jgi:lipopolysaccharide/colanic/teichoic acid biosynthesis glycosyltransferase